MNWLLTFSLALTSFPIGDFSETAGLKLKPKPLCSGIKLTGECDRFESMFSLGGGRMCKHVNHAFQIDNVFGARGNKAYYFSSSQKEANRLGNVEAENSIPRVLNDLAAFCKEHLIHDWPHYEYKSYEIFTSSLFDEDFMSDVIMAVESAEMAATEARHSISKLRSLVPAVLGPKRSIAYQKAKTKVLKEKWTELAQSLGCDYADPIEVLIIKHKDGLKKRKPIKYTRSVAYDLVLRDLSKTRVHPGTATPPMSDEYQD